MPEVEEKQDPEYLEPLVQKSIIKKYKLALSFKDNFKLKYETLWFLINLTTYDLFRDVAQEFIDADVFTTIVDILLAKYSSVTKVVGKIVYFSFWVLLNS
jgi:hypothetical protein